MHAERRLLCKTGDLIGHFRVIDACSSGSFSNVYFCQDLKNSNQVIVKCYRSEHYFQSCAQREIKLLNLLNKISCDDNFYVQILESFNYKSHFCLVLEKHGQTLYDAFKQRNFRPIRGYCLKIILHKIMAALNVLHKNGIVHTDVKLENVLVPVGFDGEKDFDIINNSHEASDAPSAFSSGSEDIGIFENATIQKLKYSQAYNKGLDIRLIDFGSLTVCNKWHKNLVTTREYRAPEVIMRSKWGVECDVWSVGCILVELALGNIVFDAENDIEHLFLIQHMISPFPQRLVNESTNSEVNQSFVSNLINPAALSDAARERCMEKPPLAQQLSFDEDLADLALKMLNPDPFERPSLEELLNHPFFDF